jgi:hypothetical protein
MMRARGLLLGGACFTVLVGADGGALAPLHAAAAAAAPRSAVAAAATRTSVAPHAPARVVASTAAPVSSWRSGTPIDLNRRNAPLDVSAVVTGVTPVDGPSAGGTDIVISGTGFASDMMDVVIGGTTVVNTCLSPGGCFTFISDTEIDATTPPGTSGSSDVIVDNPGFPGTANPPADDYTYLDQPTVTNVPNQVAEGATGVTVAGTGFSLPGPDASAVSEVDLKPTFAGGTTVALATECAVAGDPDCFGFSGSDTHMPIDLPATDILPGQYDTVVTTPGGTSPTSSNDQFVVQQDAPTVTSVSPDSGPDGGGPPTITIGGTNFSGLDFATTDVSFGGTPATSFHVGSSTTITATPPAGTGLVDVTVTTSSTDGTSVETSATSAADTYVYAPVPTVTNVSPNSGSTGGQNVVTLTGTTFESNNSGSNANFAATDVIVDLTDIGTSPCPPTPTNPCFTVSTPTKITIGYMPPHAAGPIQITVETVGGTSTASGGSQYTYQLLPAVTGVSPTAGVLGGGNNIAVTGTDFTGATLVVVGGFDFAPCGTAPCFTFNSSTSITVQGLHAHAAGTVDVTVKTPGGTSAINPSDEYAYAPIPTVTNVTPGDGSVAGTNTITVAGTGFSSGSLLTATQVTVDTTPITLTPCPGTVTAACFTVDAANSITVEDLPGDGPGTVDIRVITAGGTSPISANDQYTYIAVPTVTSVAPPNGPASGGNSVTVTGTGFQGSGFTALHVFVGLTDLTPCPGPPCFNVTGPTSISIPNMPSNAVGVINITVQTVGGTSSTSSADQYTYEPVPTVTGVSPQDGILAGGNTVTVNGTEFTGASVVKVGTTSVSQCPGTTCFNIVSAAQITVDGFPAGGSPGAVDITVTTPLGTSTTTPADQYTYMPIPTVTKVAPSAGSILGTNAVTLTGTGFEVGAFQATVVSVVGVGNTTFTVNSATSITIPSIPPDSASGIVDITVTTDGGTSATTSTDKYTYVTSFPTVTTVSPKFGAASGNSYVTIVGANFGDPTQGFGATDIIFGSADIQPCTGGSTSSCFEQIGTTTLYVYTPAVPAGTVDIQVVTGGGTSNKGIPDEYTFIAPGAYTAINPFRICDTRPVGSGIGSNQCNAAGKGTLGTGHEVAAIQMIGGQVPSGAQAVVVNITAIDHGPGPTYVVAYPAGGSPPSASNINLLNGKVGSNLAIVQLGTLAGFAGQMDAFNAIGSADVIVDVEGYFTAPVDTKTGAFHSIPPLRICDSRGGKGTECALGATNNPLIGGRWVHVVLSGVPPGVSPITPDIPSDHTAAAAAFNLTAVAGSLPTYLSVAVPTSGDACPTGQPSFSNLNPAAGTALPNRVISNLGPNQDICLYSALGVINYVIDVNGWFGKTSAGPGAFFYSVPPTRICDTRSNLGTRCQNQELQKNEHLLVHVAGILVVPAWDAHAPPPLAVVANLTGVAGTAATFFTLYPADATSPPTASDLNPSAGQVIANLTITSLAQTDGLTIDGNVDLYNPVGSINAILDVAGWFQ